jgi:hypothetical protein
VLGDAPSGPRRCGTGGAIEAGGRGSEGTDLHAAPVTMEYDERESSSQEFFNGDKDLGAGIR